MADTPSPKTVPTVNRIDTLLAMIADAYKRTATNRDSEYRYYQELKVKEWHEELTQIYENHPEIWLRHQAARPTTFPEEVPTGNDNADPKP